MLDYRLTRLQSAIKLVTELVSHENILDTLACLLLLNLSSIRLVKNYSLLEDIFEV